MVKGGWGWLDGSIGVWMVSRVVDGGDGEGEGRMSARKG